jgi:lauroyl/myristoyl acyltransferase
MYLLLRYVIATLDTLTYDFARRIGKLIGRIMYVLDAKHRKIAVIRTSSGQGDAQEVLRSTGSCAGL